MQHLTHDMWHLECDTWHLTHDMCHMKCDTMWGVKILSKFQLSSSYGSGVMMFWGKGSLTDWLTEQISMVFVEQPRLHRVC